MTQVWQIAAGTSERDYTKLFLDHDIMFMGPGKYGDYKENESIYKRAVEDGRETKRKVNMVRCFVREVKEDQIVLLRRGKSVVAIGLVHGPVYEWNETFDDVFGWDVQHTRRVVWQEHLKQELEKIQSDEDGKLFSHMGARMQTLLKVDDNKVLNRIRFLFSRCDKRPLKSMPDPPSKHLEMEEVGQELFSKGLPNDAVDRVLLAIKRQRRIFKWYETHGVKSKRPTEHEVVAHMVLPLLLALGWSEQLLALEWHRIDLAGFRSAPTTEQNCVLVCEAKYLGSGLQDAFKQPREYVKDPKLKNCHKILLTDGARFYLYEKKSQGWNDEPIGYLNVNLIRTNHLIPKKANAIDTIMALTPAGIVQEGD